jgi:hypothetical protein
VMTHLTPYQNPSPLLYNARQLLAADLLH